MCFRPPSVTLDEDSDNAKEPGAPVAPGAPSAPKAPGAPTAPEAPGAPGVPGTPKASGVLSVPSAAVGSEQDAVPEKAVSRMPGGTGTDESNVTSKSEAKKVFVPKAPL